MPEATEIAIVGGGPVGATLALALAAGGVEAVVLESRQGEQSRRRHGQIPDTS
jgi:2-polyprenyl-6-methoxyphenol hydroxylase-like FAD-dependent oxidoreductase